MEFDKNVKLKAKECWGSASFQILRGEINIRAAHR